MNIRAIGESARITFPWAAGRIPPGDQCFSGNHVITYIVVGPIS